jgi:hypothetical protein
VLNSISLSVDGGDIDRQERVTAVQLDPTGAIQIAQAYDVKIEVLRLNGGI